MITVGNKIIDSLSPALQKEMKKKSIGRKKVSESKSSAPVVVNNS